MAMTRRELLGKQQIIRKMRSEGYPTYADLFGLFDLHLTKDPSVIGYMVPEKAIICINENLDIDQVSVIIRHEILHEFLEHKKRGEVAKIPMGELSNMAADYEISNLGYTQKDKRIARAIKLGDEVLTGLVTDHDHPDWVDKTFEEMYELLKKESPQSSGKPKIGDRGNQQLQDAEDIERQAQAIQDAADDMAGQGSGSGKSSQSQAGQQGQSGSGSGDGDDGEDGQEKEDGQGGGGDSGDNDKEDGDKKGEGEGGADGKKQRNKYDDDAYKGMSPEEKKKERARRRKEAARKLKEDADKLMQELKDAMDGNKGKGGSGEGNSSSTKGGSTNSSSSGQVFDTPEEQTERGQRIAKIKKALADLQTQKQALSESSDAIMTERAVSAAKDAKRFRDNSLTRFTESLNKFIRDAIARSRNSSWAHINKKYVYSGLLRPGWSSSARGPVPLINVYFDRSGSWDSTKTEQGKQAISTLNKYVTRGEIQLKLYYFNDSVHDTDPGGSGGTNGRPIMEHIKQTKPNNVIILTDSDISDIRESVQVPGAVWLLFYGGRSKNLIEHLTGKQLTRYFDIEYR